MIEAGAIKEMTRILKSGGKLVITDLDEHDFDFLKTEHHDRWMGFDRENIKQWFIEVGFKKASLDSVEEKCTSESIRIESFFHREIMLLSHSLPFIPVRLYNELESIKELGYGNL